MRTGQTCAVPTIPGVATSGPHSSRLRIPTVSVHHVARPRLLALLDTALETSVTLVVAPAGSGKTTLLGAWAASSSTPSAWLSVDETDRDAARLWTGMLASLESLRPGCSARAAERLRRPGALPAAVTELIDDLSTAYADPAVLVLDDLHLVDDEPVVAASLARFLEHLPPWLHVVAASRRLPELPLHRMRVRAQLTELRFDELRFSAEEARALLHKLTPSLPEDRLANAVERADGWVASLQLAALAARSQRARPTQDAPGVDESVLIHDYVMQEVLAGEDGELVRTLLDVSVVERLNGELAAALTGRADAERLLRRAEERGLFVTRIGPEGWFSVHSLVRTVLCGELARQPGRRGRQHARAARWFADAGDTAAALEHLVQAGDLRATLRLLAAKAGELYDNGREATIERAIAAIPPGVAACDLEALVDFAWCHLLVDRRRFAELVDQLAWRADRGAAEGEAAARIKVLAAIAALVNGDWVRAGRLAHEALAELGEGWWRDWLGRFGWNVVARDVAFGERWDELSDEVHEIDLALSRDPQRRLAFEGTRALAEALAGRPVDALRVVAGVRHTSVTQGLSILAADLATAEALANRELGDRSAGEALEAIATTAAEATYFCRILATLELAMAALDNGDVDEARRRFTAAVGLVKEESGPGWWDWLGRVGTRVALAGSDLTEARSWAERIDDPFWRAISQARVQLATGEGRAALAGLERAEPRCVRHEVVLSLLRCRADPSPEESSKHLAMALETAAAAGLLQTVASEGADILERVEHAAWRVPAAWVDQLRRVGSTVAGEQAGRAPGRPDGWPDPRLVLTDRERDVLRFLPSRLTQREIAGELYVSVNTLKFHLKVIYRKLAVGSRAEAAELARWAYGLRPPEA